MTAKELAQELGISPATLSLVLNNKPGISDKLRNEVLTKINTLGYGKLAKSLPTRDSNQKSICFVTYLDSGKLLGADVNTFFPFIIEGIEKRSQEHGYTLTCITIHKDELEEGIERIVKSGCAGFIIFAPELKKEQIYSFTTLGLPFVLLENVYDELNVSSVKTNNRQGIESALNHLVQCEHKKIGYLASGLNYNCFMERQEHMRKIMNQIGMPVLENFFFSIGYPDSAAYEGMKKILESTTELPDAFLSDCDLVAIGAIKAFKEKGYNIPEDISFIGFDNLPICTMFEPNLTTIHIPKNALGTEAVELLFKQIDKTAEYAVRMELYTTLIPRNSVAVLN